MPASVGQPGSAIELGWSTRGNRFTVPATAALADLAKARR
jgi:hypothetical protein